MSRRAAIAAFTFHYGEIISSLAASVLTTPLFPLHSIMVRLYPWTDPGIIVTEYDFTFHYGEIISLKGIFKKGVSFSLHSIMVRLYLEDAVKVNVTLKPLHSIMVRLYQKRETSDHVARLSFTFHYGEIISGVNRYIFISVELYIPLW